MIPFLVATVIRFIQGSATVAMITAASITAPILMQLPGVNMLFAAQAAAAGGFFFSYFNDSLFWVLNRMMGVTDVKQQIISWSVSTSIIWAIGGVQIALVNLVFGSGGSLLDPLIPLLGLGIIYLVLRRKNDVLSLSAAIIVSCVAHVSVRKLIQQLFFTPEDRSTLVPFHLPEYK
jgi:hypothetical protein